MTPLRLSSETVAAPLAIITALLSGGVGCSTALSTMQPADTLPPGDFHVGAGMTMDLPVTRVIGAVDAAATVADKYSADAGYKPTEEEQRDYLDAAIGLALNAPGATNDFMLRYGLLDRVDAGLRYTGTAVHLDAKYQFMGQPSGGWSGSVSLGYGHHRFKGFVFDALEFLTIDDFSRYDIEVPIIFGRRLGQIGYLWLGPKYVFADVTVDAKLRNVDMSLAVEDTIHYFGGFLGCGIGYRKVHAFAELTVMDMVSKPVILGKATDIGGVIVVPAAGLMARF